MTIPLIRRLKAFDPDCSLIFVCRPGFGEFFERLGLVDEVLELDKRNVTGLEEFRERLSRHSIRYLISVHQSVRTALALRKIRAEYKISYRLWWNRPFFDLRVTRPMELPEPLRVLALLSQVDGITAAQIADIKQSGVQKNLAERAPVLNWPEPIPQEYQMTVEPNKAAVEQVRGLVSSPYVVVAPSSQWSTKQWTTEGYADLIGKLTNKGLNVYLVGTRNERDVCERVRDAAGPNAKSVVRSFAGRFDLVQLHALMSEAQAIVANDSGTMHLAAVAGRPIIGIFGPTVLKQGYRPWSNDSAVLQVDVRCRPCGRHGHKKCPIGTHECMKKISADLVMNAVERFIFLRKET